jgi:glutathione S-transferase
MVTAGLDRQIRFVAPGIVARVRVTLYWLPVSHPSQAARKMLELKHVGFDAVEVLPFNQRIHMRLAGFRGGTVPGLKLDRRRVQGSRRIARALDQLWPEPPLFPADPGLRARVIDAERWGEERLQPIPRRLARFGLATNPDLRRWAVKTQPRPAPELAAALISPIARYYARGVELDGRRGDEAGVRADLAALPELLDRVEAMLADGTLATDPPNAATLQVLSSVRLLLALEDLRDVIGGPAAAAALELFPRYPVRMPAFLPREWLPERPAPHTIA